MVADTREARPTLEDRVLRLEISNLYRTVTRRLLEIYDEQRQHATDVRGHGDPVQPSVGEKAVHGPDGLVEDKDAARGSVDQGTCGSRRSKDKKRSSPTITAGTASWLIRVRDAPAYLGMDKNRFNREVRPHLIEIPIGRQGIGFDRLDLDAWIEDYKKRNARPWKAIGGKPLWDKKCRQGSSKEVKSGTSERRSQEERFKKALERAISKKPNAS